MLDDIAISVLMRAKQIICNEYFPSEKYSVLPFNCT